MTYTKRITWIAAVAVVGAGLGCGGDGTTTPPSAMRENDVPPVAQAKASASANEATPSGPVKPAPRGSLRSVQPAAQQPGQQPAQAVAGKPAAAAQVVAENIPADARYTILCSEYVGESHVQSAMYSKNNFTQATGRGEFHVLIEDQRSQLFFGYYRTADARVDAAEAKRLDADQAWLRTLATPGGQKIFRSTAVVPLQMADPAAPPEFDLARIDADKAPDDPNRAYWTIAIAAYTADARGEGEDAGKTRKQLAVDTVLLARQKYKVPAYYHHGETVSTVCVGAWPRHAVREQETDKAESKGDVGESLVVSPAPLPDRITQQLQASGKNVKVLQPKIDIVDPDMLETWKQFPEYSVDGRVQANQITDPKTGKRTSRAQSSFLVEIPRAQPTLLRGGGGTPAEDAPPPSMLTPTRPREGEGRLRSVGQ